MLEVLTSPAVWMSLLTLTFLEVVLGVDNVVFVSVASQRLKPEEQTKGRDIGIWSGAMMRIVLLFALVWLTGLTHATLFTLPEMFVAFADSEHPERLMQVTLEDIILFFGGLFLLWKGTEEIHTTIEGHHEKNTGGKTSTLTLVVIQMTAINVVFSLDSVLTAVGMTQEFGGPDAAGTRLFIMVSAVVISTVIMVASATQVASFLERHATAKMLALSFILLVGVALVADGLGFHIPRGYLYFAIAFSLFVEVLNILARGRRKAELEGEA
ncbi:TerC family protein [Maricaulis sp.]|uniref:TerC family protein n=1 Tax=Maricaulis sp. TaxID=1486257 RepID=UPI002618EC2A|nr:TerC family protein [Maricaulis sp.]